MIEIYDINIALHEDDAATRELWANYKNMFMKQESFFRMSKIYELWCPMDMQEDRAERMNQNGTENKRDARAGAEEDRV